MTLEGWFVTDRLHVVLKGRALRERERERERERKCGHGRVVCGIGACGSMKRYLI